MDELKKLRNDLDMCDEILIDALRMLLPDYPGDYKL